MKAMYLFILIILHNSVYSQDQDYLLDFDLSNDSIFYAVGTNGIIVKTTNRGESWFDQTSNESNYLWSVDFINADLGWIKSSNKIIKTTDGGSSWIEIADIPFLSSGKMLMINKMIGWLTGYYDYPLLKTNDGGFSWELFNPFLEPYIFDIFFLDSLSGWVTGTSSVPFHHYPFISFTSNGGIDWYYQYGGYQDTEINSVFFISSIDGWAVGSSGIVLKTTNGGISWEEYHLQTSQNLQEVLFINDQKGWISSGYSSQSMDSIFITNDGGDTWDRVSYGKLVRSVKFSDEQNGYALTAYSLLSSNDGGYTWSTNIILSNDEIGNYKSVDKFSLTQNYPNPFNPVTKIKYGIPSAGASLMKLVQLKIFDVRGREIATLVNEEKPAGEYEVEFDGSDLPSGIYLYRIKVGDYIKTKKMVLLK